MKTALVKRVLICSLGTLLYVRAEAQPRTQFIRFGGGVTPLQMKDYFHSDYTYRGTGVSLQAAYGQESVRTHWDLEAGYGQANLQSIVSRKSATRIVDAVFSYRWRLSPASRAGNPFQYYAGPALRLFGARTNYSPDIEVPTVQTTAAMALGASVKAGYRFSPRHFVSLHGFASVISAVYRPDYAYYSRDQLKTSWVGRSPILDAQVSYQYHFRNRYQAMATYQINSFKYDQPRPVFWLRQNFSIGVRRSF